MPIERGRPSLRADLFGGSGGVKVWDLLAGVSMEPFTAVLSCELAPAGVVGRHRQEAFPEIVLGLEGDGVANVDGTEQPLGPGDVVWLPLGSFLALRNRSDQSPLRYLIIKARDTGGVTPR
ncbi:MAG TPA: cupin domain-containing protein [Deltaproteobacteria bacterium]|nr:cupin domain-containing protein [Deltaproteobacteria bacterium]